MVRRVLRTEFELEADAIGEATHLVDDLDLDSVDAVALAVRLEEETDLALEEEALKAMRTVRRRGGRGPRAPRALTLARLLVDGRPPRSVGRLRARGPSRPRATCAPGSRAWRGGCASTGGSRWLVHCEDAYAFAVSLFAVAHAGAVAVLLPNRQPGALARAAHLADGALADAAPGEALAPLALASRVLDPLDEAGRARAPRDRSRPSTSTRRSSSSRPRAPPARARRCRRRSATSRPRWPCSSACSAERSAPATPVFATASPQHLYGLLFRVLWPLASGPARSMRRPGSTPRSCCPRIEEAGDAAPREHAGAPARA